MSDGWMQRRIQSGESIDRRFPCFTNWSGMNSETSKLKEIHALYQTPEIKLISSLTLYHQSKNLVLTTENGLPGVPIVISPLGE